MKYKQRKQLRLKNFDYKSNAYYFVTICTYNRINYFGKIENSQLIPQTEKLYQLLKNSIEDISTKFPNVNIIQYTLMPNHIHFILANESNGKYSLGQIIRRFKSTSTNSYKKEMIKDNLIPLRERLWQRSYHEIIIKSQRQLEALWKYSEENPLKWELDKYYKDNISR